ncbi:MAG: tRNA pseudouridine(65) synthase TruC, partial [Anaerolineales bacterium]|nr:tRNA pseudouridine(65) synthase TruC [Anaerolineales bacterium]
MLQILYQDEALVAIHKPAGLLVHRTYLASEAAEFALQQVRDQIGQHVYPVHRLDRPT